MRKNLAPENVEVIARSLEIPWSLAFASDGRLFFTERVGRINVIENGEIRNLLNLDVEATVGDESGLLGLTLDPDFAHNNFIYVYYTYRTKSGRILNKVSRFKDGGNKLSDETIILNRIPGGRVHNGGRIKFGPDGKLYVTTGETWHPNLAQRLDSLGGKILRLNPDGSMPKDNPFPGSPIYCYGIRNSQGLAWHPDTGALYATDHGPSGEWDQYAHDEINLIEPGKNYGWPHVIGDGNDPKFTNPVYHTGDVTWAPSGATFYNGPRYPQWKNKLFLATLRGQHLRVVTLKPPDFRSFESSFALFEGELGRLRDVVQGPDDYLYLCTNNRDGRGKPHPEDDIIVKLKSSYQK